MTTRILFLCPCIEPGRSGVGDYTVGLAAAAESIGVRTQVLAFADPGAEAGEKTTWCGQQVAAIRLPPSRSPGQLRSAIQTAIAEFSPDWISLQWVPYAFHPKGLMAWGDFPWEVLPGTARMHWMIHETWIGGFAGAPWKMRLTGWVQRWMMRRLFVRLDVRQAHTSNATYVRQLKKAGMAALELPLFGALPIGERTKPWSGWEVILGAERGAPITSDRERFRIFCFFGTIHTGFPDEETFQAILESGAKEGRTAVILSLGHAGAGGDRFDAWAHRWGDRMIFRRLGHLGDEVTAAVLARSDYGLSTTPLNIIGKSSAAATLSEQGLPVLTGSVGAAVEGWLPGLRDEAPRFWLARDYLANRLHDTESRPEIGSRRMEVARRFLSDLESAL